MSLQALYLKYLLAIVTHTHTHTQLLYERIFVFPHTPLKEISSPMALLYNTVFCFSKACKQRRTKKHILSYYLRVHFLSRCLSPSPPTPCPSLSHSHTHTLTGISFPPPLTLMHARAPWRTPIYKEASVPLSSIHCA